MENCEIMDSDAAEPCNEIHAVERRSDKTSDRIHVNVLLELSEEELRKELHPHEYRCNQGWEEAVCGWARVAPLASILLSKKADHKPKHKEQEHDSSTFVQPDDLTEQPGETQWRPPTRVRSTTSSQIRCTKNNGSNPTPESPEIPFLDGISKTMAQLFNGAQTRDTRTPFQHQVISKCSLTDNRSPKPRKNSLKTYNALVPIKNITFLPPINMPQNQQNSNNPQQSDLGMENFLIIQKLSRIRGTKGDLVYTELPKDAYNETVSSKYRTCQHNPHYYSAVSVTVPERYHVTMSSKPETLHPAGYSVSKTLHSGNAANTQIHPSCLYS